MIQALKTCHSAGRPSIRLPCALGSAQWDAKNVEFRTAANFCVDAPSLHKRCTCAVLLISLASSVTLHIHAVACFTFTSV